MTDLNYQMKLWPEQKKKRETASKNQLMRAQLTQQANRITIGNTEVKRMITLRLDPKLEQAVNITAKNLGLTKSELIRKCISDYIGKTKSLNAWNAGKDLFGKYSSNQGNLSVDRKRIVKEKIRAKH